MRKDRPRAATSVTMRIGQTPALNFAVLILRAAWSIVPKTQLREVLQFFSAGSGSRSARDVEFGAREQALKVSVASVMRCGGQEGERCVWLLFFRVVLGSCMHCFVHALRSHCTHSTWCLVGAKMMLLEVAGMCVLSRNSSAASFSSSLHLIQHIR